MRKIKGKIFFIPKKHGYRKIITYNQSDSDIELRKFHVKIASLLYKRVLPSKFAKAYIKNRSIIKNAKTHMYNDIFIMFDIKDFFQSINHNRLIKKLYYEINLNNRKKLSMVSCSDIIKSCSISNRGLAVGLIPSPFLANIYLKDFDNILYGNLKKLNLKNIMYTRYADDLTISYKSDTPLKIEKIEKIVCENLKKFGLKLNCRKTRSINLNKSNHVKVTGINIIKMFDNYRQLSVGRKRKDDLYNLAIKISKKNFKEHKENEINKIKVKGLQSFILSVEGEKYEQCYSENMMSVIHDLGYKSLKQLIDNI
ncbi:hypothetical protein KM800_13545 [Clostridium tyrobutyricum]|uniref:reverse transcriptase domain-containing protein n=1 Tax=Clostridium tyrobutyricum TaxID=1519 RepID=UPI001C388A9D|nr:reverse transcriptase domain-containing protein [Clostridium tyrobutyricum]MBV4420330.1 hypothetical protein [Clostridium tyrobutyricum]